MGSRSVLSSFTGFFSLVLLLLFSSSCKQGREVTVGELQDHVEYLSSDLLKGRRTGSAGDSLAAEYIVNELKSYGLKPFNGDGFQRFRIEGRENIVSARNTVMILPGEDEILKNEYIILGAHYDHLGMGGKGSSSRKPDSIAVHHGADDNASGVGLMLELAEKFALTKGSHKRSLIFIGFSGEELGLLGSKHFVSEPGIDLTDVNAMINLDMVGRLRETRTIQIGGVGTAEGLKDMVININDTNMVKLALSDEGYGPSDHFSFYSNNIPVLFFSTGAHLDYHTPDDTPDKLNYEGMVTISSLVFKIITDLANSTDRLSFRESGPQNEKDAVMKRSGPTLGIMPDFAGVIKNGLRADFVTPGRPAALGGMIQNDIIKSVEGIKVNNIEEYMERMSHLKTGQTISVEILRDTTKMVLLIQL